MGGAGCIGGMGIGWTGAGTTGTGCVGLPGNGGSLVCWAVWKMLATAKGATAVMATSAARRQRIKVECFMMGSQLPDVKDP